LVEWLQEGKKAKSQTFGSKSDKKQSTALAKSRAKVGKGLEKITEEADSAEEERSDDDDDGESKMDEAKGPLKEKVTKPIKVQQKIPKSKTADSKDDVKSDKAKPEQSKQNKVSLYFYVDSLTLSVFLQIMIIFNFQFALVFMDSINRNLNQDTTTYLLAHPFLTLAMQSGTRFICPGGIKG